MAYKILDTKPFPKDQINLSSISYLLVFLVWVMCLCFVTLEAFVSMFFGSEHPKDCIQAATRWLDGRKWRVLPYLLSSLQFLMQYGEMKTHSYLLWVIIQNKPAQGFPVFLLGQSISAWNVLCVGYPLSMDVRGNQAISISQASWTNRRQEQRYLEDGVMSLAGIEDTAAECRFRC